MKKLGLVILWIMTIPSWLFLFTWLFVVLVKAVVPNSLDVSEGYNWQLLDLGENPEVITVNRVMFYEFIEGEHSLFDISIFPDQEKLIYDLKNKEQIEAFFKTLAVHEKPNSICYTSVGKNYFRIRTLDHSLMKEGTLTFHFCKLDNQNFAVVEVDDNQIHTDYFASSELANFLETIGIEPR